MIVIKMKQQLIHTSTIHNRSTDLDNFWQRCYRENKKSKETLSELQQQSSDIFGDGVHRWNTVHKPGAEWSYVGGPE